KTYAFTVAFGVQTDTLDLPVSARSSSFVRLPGTTRVGGVGLQVSDLPRSLAYYRDVVGFRVIDVASDVARLGAPGSDAALVHPYDKGYVAACDAIATVIRALATPDQIAALAAKVDASQAPNPAVNGGRCQSDTIPLPRAEVEALMELLRRAKHCIGDNYLHWQGEAGVALATLQERMK
ncbi:MAG TPA: VOC family protein, partial [Caldilinea sp.]|nr:VOC family protein [Caldilinea sp.]